MKKHTFALAALLALTIAACGGSGSDDNTPGGTDNGGTVDNKGAGSLFAQPIPPAPLPQSKADKIRAIIDTVGSDDARKAIANSEIKGETLPPELKNMAVQTMIGLDKEGKPISGDELKDLKSILAKLMADGEDQLTYKDNEALYLILQNHKYSGTLMQKIQNRSGKTSATSCGDWLRVSAEEYYGRGATTAPLPNSEDRCCRASTASYTGTSARLAFDRDSCVPISKFDGGEDDTNVQPFVVKSMVGRIALADEVKMWDTLAKEGKMNKSINFSGKAYSTGRGGKIESGNLKYTLDLTKMTGSGEIANMRTINMSGKVLTVNGPIKLLETESLLSKGNEKHALFNSQGVIVRGTAEVVNAVFEKNELVDKDKTPDYFVAFGGSVPNSVMGAIVNAQGEGVVPFNGLRTTPLQPQK